MTTIKERLTAVEVHIDGHNSEIQSLRDSRHAHANIIQAIPDIKTSITELTKAVTNITGIVNKAIWMSIGGMAVGTVLITILGYMGYIAYNTVKILLEMS